MKRRNQTSPCHCINLKRAASAVAAYYDACLKPAGLTISQYSLLINISRVEPTGVSALAGRTGLERTTLTRALKPLLEAGLIEDLAEPGRRGRRLRLAPDGRRALEEAKPLWGRAQNGLEQKIGAGPLAQLTELLAALEEI
jgi:DNA-binding MarR family transcriptional regulator